jgi:hypothetical protein
MDGLRVDRVEQTPNRALLTMCRKGCVVCEFTAFDFAHWELHHAREEGLDRGCPATADWAASDGTLHTEAQIRQQSAAVTGPNSSTHIGHWQNAQFLCSSRQNSNPSQQDHLENGIVSCQ